MGSHWGAKVKPETGDFFVHGGKYDFIWDCTFLCAIPPELRIAWAAKMAAYAMANRPTLISKIHT